MGRIGQLIKISFRNILRNKRRTILTLMILMLGSTGLLLVGGFFENLVVSYREQYIHSQTGHLQINREGYFKKGTSAPFNYLISHVDSLQQALESQPHVLYTIPRLKFGGMVSNENNSVAVLAVGTDPLRERRMGSVKVLNSGHSSSRIIAGKDLDPQDPRGVVLGKGLINNLGVRVGDRINFLTTREAGTIDGIELQVRGVFETVAKDFDDRAMKMDLRTAQELLGVPDQVHTLLVMLDNTQKTDSMKATLAALLKGQEEKFETVTWEEHGAYYRQASDMLNHIFFTVQLIVIGVFLFSIANTINMALMERMREFGTMMAMGNSRGLIFGGILLEALMLGVAGSALGLACGAGAAKLVSSIGIEMPPIPMGSAGYDAMITLTPRLMAGTFALVLGSTVLSSILPAYRASHTKIVQALGYV